MRLPRQTLLRLLLAATFCLCLQSPANAEADIADNVKVRGMGFLGNRDLLRILFLLGEDFSPPYDHVAIEDAFFVMRGKLEEEGFLQPILRVELLDEDNNAFARYSWVGTSPPPDIPLGLSAHGLRFRVDSGPRYFFREIEHRIEGDLPAGILPPVASFFVPTGFLWRDRESRLFSEDRLNAALGNIRSTLEEAGYLNARVLVQSLERRHHSGEVYLGLLILTGRRHDVVGMAQAEVTSLRGARGLTFRRIVEEAPDADEAVGEFRAIEPVPLSRSLLERQISSLREEYLVRGYPDVIILPRLYKTDESENSKKYLLRMDVRPGPQVTLAGVEFTGADRLWPNLLQRQVNQAPGEPLDLTMAERGRRALLRLPAVASANLSMQPADGDSRSVVYDLELGKTIDFSLLAGVGSYEGPRGGAILEHRNLFARSHVATLQATQSFKAQRTNLRYRVPEIFGEDVDLVSETDRLRREEPSFERRETGTMVGADFRLPGIRSRASVRYNFEFFEARRLPGEDALVRRALDDESVQSASLGGSLRRDQIDNPLFPTRGTRYSLSGKVSHPVLASKTRYQKIGFTIARHQPVLSSLILHLDFRHGSLLNLGSETGDNPFGERFFPGGENTIRSFRQGFASPRDEEGRIIGAATTTLFNIQIEQRITEKLSLNLFLDNLLQSAEMASFPGDEHLHGLGIGLSYRTIIGPIRLEYAHNLRQRPGDSSGALHFAVGYPF